MKYLLYVTVSQFLLLLLLFAKNKNDGGKELFRSQPWTTSDVVIIVSTINVIAFLVYFLSGIHVIQPFFNNNRLFIFNFLLLLLIISVIRFRGKQLFEILGFKKHNLLESFFLGIGTAIGIWLVFNILYKAIGKSDDYAINIVNDIKGLRNHLDTIIYVLMAVVIAPITEECVYRGMLYSPFRKKYGPIIASIFNALLFAGGHFGPSIGPFFITGMLFCLLYEKTESIVSCIIAHGVNNLLGILSAYYFMKIL